MPSQELAGIILENENDPHLETDVDFAAYHGTPWPSIQGNYAQNTIPWGTVMSVHSTTSHDIMILSSF